MNMKVNLK